MIITTTKNSLSDHIEFHWIVHSATVAVWLKYWFHWLFGIGKNVMFLKTKLHLLNQKYSNN